MNLQETFEQIQNLDLSDIDRIGVWPIFVRAALWVAAVVVIFVATYFLFIKDLQVQLGNAERREIQLRSDFEGKAAEAQYLDDYRAQMQTLEEQLQGLVSQLPTETEQPELLVDIEEKGALSGLEITDTDFLDEQVGEIYVERAIKLSATGGYHEFGTFVSGLAGMPRIVTLHDFKLTSESNTGALEIDLTAKTYRYKSQDD